MRTHRTCLPDRQVLFSVVGLCLAVAAPAQADTFGTGVNQFDIDFVTISGDTNPASGIPAGASFTFTGVDNDYRIGTYEITNDQWNKFQASTGVPVTGIPSTAYNQDSNFTGANVPTDNVSWYEAAQFVNWLNTSTGHHAAYNFYETTPGDPGTRTFDVWTPAEADGGTNLYRHKEAFYFLPTADEWVKAAYWNGTDLQTHATKAGESVHQGDGVSGSGWHYRNYDGSWAAPLGPWDVGSGSEELNGTFDMMGNVYEWHESPDSDPNYGAGSGRAHRAGSWAGYIDEFSSTYWHPIFSLKSPQDEYWDIGFRMASQVPEPATLFVMGCGAIGLLRRRRPKVRRGGSKIRRGGRA